MTIDRRGALRPPRSCRVLAIGSDPGRLHCSSTPPTSSAATLFSAPLAWAEEVLSFLIIWGVCLGASAVTYDRRHLAMDIMMGGYTPAVRRMVDGAILVTIVGFCTFTAFQAWTIVQIMARNGQVSVTAEIPMTVPYLGFVVGFSMIVLAALAAAWFRGRRGDTASAATRARRTPCCG